MGFSVRGIGSYDTVSPMYYSVAGESLVSSAFAETVEKGQNPNSVNAVSPVTYANAQINSQEVNAVDAATKAAEANQMMNSIAAGFTGVTGYASDLSGSSYAAIVGSQFDKFA